MPRHNHMYTIAFSIESENEGAFATADEILKGLRNRLELLSLSANNEFPEILEAVGMPQDSYELETPVKTEMAIAAFNRGEIREGFRLAHEAIAQDNLDGYHRTPLQWACEYGITVAVERLLETMVNVNEMNKQGKSALHYAAKSGNPEIVEMLLQAGSYTNACDNFKNTPLHLACQGGHTEIGISLIKAGADIEAKNINGDNPLSLEFADGINQWLTSQACAQEIEQAIQNDDGSSTKKAAKGLSL